MPPKEIINKLLTDDGRGRKVKGEILRSLLKDISSSPEKLDTYLEAIYKRLNEFPN